MSALAVAAVVATACAGSEPAQVAPAPPPATAAPEASPAPPAESAPPAGEAAPRNRNDATARRRGASGRAARPAAGPTTRRPATRSATATGPRTRRPATGATTRRPAAGHDGRGRTQRSARCHGHRRGQWRGPPAVLAGAGRPAPAGVVLGAALTDVPPGGPRRRAVRSGSRRRDPRRRLGDAGRPGPGAGVRRTRRDRLVPDALGRDVRFVGGAGRRLPARLGGSSRPPGSWSRAATAASTPPACWSGLLLSESAPGRQTASAGPAQAGTGSCEYFASNPSVACRYRIFTRMSG